MLGLKDNGELSVVARSFDRASGMSTTPNSIYLGSRNQIWVLRNVLKESEFYQAHDALYVPYKSYAVGDVDIHDIVVTSVPVKIGPMEGRNQG